MHIPVLVEPVAGAGYVARTGSPFDWTAAGATPEEAVRALQAVVTSRVATGARVATVEVAPESDALAQLRAKGAVVELPPPVPGQHPLAGLIGSLRGNPLLDEWRKAVQEYREEIENDPNR